MRQLFRILIAAAAAAVIAEPTLAQSSVQQAALSAPPAPCKDDSLHRRFDFWVGHWKVTDVAGTEVGTSRVEIVSGGCALLENWHDVQGSEGKSLNTYDAAKHQWRQFWVGQGGRVTDYSESEWNGPSISFFVHYGTTPSSRMDRLTFTPLAADLVQQHDESSTDGGKTWATVYDFRYHRIQ